ncbi:hypothetical protein DL771_001312 [Monosporascus sp. 5C6A]|nr:hypothetical protein DL771_001312 [Monosporascus sp. 5C6A]
MVAIQIVSDLHLESPKAYDIFNIPAKAPYLALLGDIGYIKHAEEYIAFLKRQLSTFRVVFFVLGNHEPWHSSWEHSKNVMRQFAERIRQERENDSELGEFVLLDQARYDIDITSEDTVSILGCTLFSRVPAESMEAVSFGVNDFYHIKNWTVEQHNAEFDRDLGWLNEQVASLEGTGRKVAILTHYSPTLDERAVDPRHRLSPIQPGFASDLSDQPCYLGESVKLWAFGHTHFNCDFVDAKAKRFVTNQRGYYFSQSEGFKGDRVIEL